MNKDQFMKRFKAAKKRKQVNWETLYREAMELFCPNRENFYNNYSGETKGRQVYTSNPNIALDKASNNMHSSLTPHMKNWVHMKPGRMIPDENKEEAGKQLDEITKTLFSHIHASNFDLAISEFYKDLVIGTAAILVTSTPKQPLIFNSVPLDQLYIAPGALGTIDKVFREYKIAAGNLEDTWPDAKLSQELTQMAAETPDKEITVCEGVLPKKITIINAETKREEQRDGFGYYVCTKKQDAFLVERDMPINPWIVSRWSVMSGEEWGRGPAIIALQDAKTLNQFIKLHIQSMELTVHPMYTVVDDGIINIQNIRIGPGKMIPVSANDGAFGASIAPLRSGGNFNAGQLEIERLEASINDQLYTEPLGPVNLPVKTATEVSIRQADLAKRIGSAFGRLQYELIAPMVNACLYYLDNASILNMNDFKVDGQNIEIDVVSPLAQGQSQDDIDKVVQYVQFAIGTFGPEVALAYMKPDEIIEYVGENLNIPKKLKLTEQDKQKGNNLLENLSLQQGVQAIGGQQQAVQ